MKRLLMAIALTGCVAEGDLPETDMGTVTPDFGRPDLSTNNTSDAGADDGFEYGVACDPLAQDCEKGKCVPTPGTGTATCLQLGEQRAVGQACDSITQCVKGSHCALLPDETVSVCRAMCDRSATTDTCAAPTTCAATLSSGVGLCAAPPTACDIYLNDCAAGDCVVMQNPESGGVGTFCGQAGPRKAGEACGGAAGECEAGNICVLRADQTVSTCQPVCRNAEDGPIRACPQNSACTGTAAASGVTFCQ